MSGHKPLDTKAAWTIARKLRAEVREKRKHTFAVVRINGVYIGQYGISRGSKGSYNYIPNQIRVSTSVALGIAGCSLGLADYTNELQEKGILPASSNGQSLPDPASSSEPI